MKPRLRPSTWANYRTYTAAYVVPILGQIKLQALTPVQLNHLYAHLLERGRRKTISGGRRLAPKTVRNVHVMLHSALHDAMRWGYLVRNVAEAADPPAARSPSRRSGRPRSWARSSTMSATTACTPCGCWSPPPACAAASSPAALGRHRLRPRHRLPHHSPGGRRPPGRLGPQDRAGRRRLALDPVTLAALHAQRRLQAEDRQAVGGRYRDHGYVFTWPTAAHYTPENIANWFEQHTRAAGLPRIRLHDVRHSYATAALKAGISAKVISERLGHASVAFTLQTYSHVIPGMDRDAAATVADLILTSTQKGPGIPDPSANKTANNGPQSDPPIKEVKDERPAQ